MILVTGATGFIGRSLMRALQRKGHEPRAYRGHINDREQLTAALRDVELVYHLASAEARGRPRYLQHIDVQGAASLVRAAHTTGVQRIVLVSRLHANPNSIFPLLRAKGEAERLIRQSGIAYTIVRSASLFGPEDRYLNLIASLAAWTWPLLWLPGGGEGAQQPLWVEDMARCLTALAQRPDLAGQTLSIAGEDRLRYRELALMVAAAAGLKRIPVKVDLRIVRPLSVLTMAWWRRPPVTSYALNRFSLPDVAPFDSVPHTFGFRAERLVDHLAFLRRGGWRRRLFTL